MSLIGYGYSGRTTPASGEKKEDVTAQVSQRSFLLEPRKRYESPCFCTSEIDLDVFRGVFTDQWLHGRAYGNNEEIFFCTSCGPGTIQDELRQVKHARGVSGETQSNGSKSSTGGSPAPKSTSAKLKKFFSLGFSSSSSSIKRQSSNGALANTRSTSESGKPLCHGSAPRDLDDEELPVTPRSEKELFLCVTCGACYCRDHARDHHYSRRYVETNADTAAPSKGYPYHSYFVGVPSYVSTHKEHRLKETEWGLLLPTVFIKEVQPYINTLATSQRSPVETPPTGDKKKSKSSLRLHNTGGTPSTGQSTLAPLSPLSASPVLSRAIPFYANFVELCDGAASRQLSAAHSHALNGAGTSLSSSYAETPKFTAAARDGDDDKHHRGPQGSQLPTASQSTSAVDEAYTSTGGSSNPPTTTTTTVPSAGSCPLSPPCFYTSPPENWSFLVWCASCGERPIRFSGRHYDDEKDLHRHLRRLGQLLAVLAYFRRAGVQLRLPEAYLTYMDRKQAEQHARQVKQRIALSSVEAQRVTKSSEGFDGTSSTGATTAAATSGVDNYYGECLYDRSSTDRIMTEAALAGFANPSFYCYVNSVFQCVLRCTLFCRPLLRPLVGPNGKWSTNGPLKLTLPPEGQSKAAAATSGGDAGTMAPGKLTLSFVRLMDQLLHQTYQDVRNGAAYPFARTVFHQVCRVCPLFEQGEQQDSQEFLISLLNGIADEFDKGRSEAERKQMKRISFEGVLRHEVVCSSCFHRVPRDEMFMALSIPAKSSIEAGLKSVFDAQKLRGSDKYACEYCFKKLSRTEQTSHNDLAQMYERERKELAKSGKKPPAPKESGEGGPIAKDCIYQDAEVHTIIAQLGGTLAIHILRFQYDAALQDFSKVTAPVKIPLTLDLSPYVDTDVIRAYSNARSLFTLSQRFPDLSEEALAKRLAESKWDCAAATRAMQEVLGEGPDHQGPGSALTKDGAERGSSAAGATPLNKSAPSTRRKKEVQALKRADFNPFGVGGSRCPSLQRQLVGIVAHRGSLHGGHYIAFVRLLSQPDVWFRCDDEDVDVVDEKTVLNCSSEVYLAFYE